MGDDLPTEYDCIVIGTGMTESVVAAAASRVGKRVLHLDSNEYYGGLWASFNFDGLQNWLADCRKQLPNSETVAEDLSDLVKEGESLIKAGNQFSVFFNIEENWYISEDLAESLALLSLNKITQTDSDHHDKAGSGDMEASKTEDESEKHERDTVETEKDDEGHTSSQPKYWSQSKLKEEYRKFNLDLAPKLLFARGSLVELLISSNIARYAEFRSVTRVLTWLEGQLEPVPCSRADVFATRHVSVVEKRMLMKLLTACMEYSAHAQEFEGFENKTFLEYLKARKLTPNLIHYVLYSIAMATDTTPCMEGVTRTQRFLNSLGRYGNTPFLWPMYGSGEIPQCFCRLCAVFGGVYHLKRAAEAVIVGPGLGDSEKKCLGIMSAGQRLNTNQLVLGVGHAPPQFVETTPTGGLSRGIFITDRSILPTDKESLTLLQFPSMDGKAEPVTVIELGPSTNACPKGMYVVHMTSKQQLTAKEDLQQVVEKLLNNKMSDTNVERVTTDTQSTQTVSVDETGARGEESGMEKSDKPDKLAKAPKPQVLWSLYFNCPETSDCDLSANTPPNVFLCSGPDLNLDFEFAVKQAREIFSKMYPNCEFLPRAPDPEEIILEGEETAPGPSFGGTGETNDTEELRNDQAVAQEDDDDAIDAEASENAMGKE